MLSITEKQFVTLGEQAFRRKLTSVMTDKPEERAWLESAEGQAVIERQIAAARSHGFEVNHDIARYVIAAWLLGENFATMPAIAAILVAPDLNAQQKAVGIERFTTDLFDTLEKG